MMEEELKRLFAADQAAASLETLWVVIRQQFASHLAAGEDLAMAYVMTRCFIDAVMRSSKDEK
jgi:hypothetical protein